MNYNDVVVFDYETTGKNSETAQVVQIAAIVVNSRKWEIKTGTEFNMLIKPLYGEEAAKANLEELSDGAIKIHGKTHDMLKDCPSIKAGLENFKGYVDEHNYKKTQWSAPIPAGYNIVGYDCKILDRDLNRFNMSSFFHPIIKLDLMLYMWPFFENNPDVNSLSADNLIRGYMGYDKGTAHDALSDVIMTAELLCKTMHLMRRTAKATRFKGCFNV